MSNRLATGTLFSTLLIAPNTSFAADPLDYQGHFASKAIEDGLLDCLPTVYSKALHKIQFACTQSYVYGLINFGNDTLFVDTLTGRRHHIRVSVDEDADFVTEEPLGHHRTASETAPCLFGAEKDIAVASTAHEKLAYSGDPATAPHAVGCGVAPDGTLNLFVETVRDRGKTSYPTAYDLHWVTRQKQVDLGIVAAPGLARSHVDPGRTTLYQVTESSTRIAKSGGDLLTVLDLSTGDLKTYPAKPNVRWLDYDPGTHTALIAVSPTSTPLPSAVTITGSLSVDLCEAAIDTQTCLSGRPIIASDFSIFTPNFGLAHRYANGDGFMPWLQTKAINGFYWF